MSILNITAEIKKFLGSLFQNDYFFLLLQNMVPAQNFERGSLIFDERRADF